MALFWIWAARWLLRLLANPFHAARGDGRALNGAAGPPEMTAESFFICKMCPEHKKSSRLDYALGSFMIVYGAFLLMPEHSMSSHHYAIITRWGTELFWGFAFLFVGVLQAFSIYINSGQGWTPYARAATNYCAMITWASISIGIGSVDPWSTSVVNYSMLSLAHLFCAVTAARDATKIAFAHHGG